MPAPPADRQALGDTVRVLRAEARLTQEELAARAGLGRKFISDLERGARRASFDAVVAVADALGVGLDALVADYVKRAERAP